MAKAKKSKMAIKATTKKPPAKKRNKLMGQNFLANMPGPRGKKG